MEEKIYDRQVTKQSLSMRVIDEKQIGRHFSFAQLQELFVYTPPPPPSDTPPDKPYENPESDIIFCSILKKLRPEYIVGYHTHDSLLEHNFDEELSEEEQKIAWDNYNNQKEMDNRAYNMSLRLQQNVLQDGTNVQVPTGITGISLPSSSGMGMGPKPIVNIPANSSPQEVILFNAVKDAMIIAGQVKSLAMLRNKLKDIVLNPSEINARQNYIKSFTVLSKKLNHLQIVTPKLSDMFRNPMLRSTLPNDSLRQFDMLKEHFLSELRVIDSLTSVPAPTPIDLMRIQPTPLAISQSNTTGVSHNYHNPQV